MQAKGIRKRVLKPISFHVFDFAPCEILCPWQVPGEENPPGLANEKITMRANLTLTPSFQPGATLLPMTEQS
jgi:hypothetical protein